MRNEALFINGIYEGTLEPIVEVQKDIPEQVLYLQPYSGYQIKRLAEIKPSVNNPIRLFASITNDLSHIHYIGDIVGWEDKREMSDKRREKLNRIVEIQDEEIYLEIDGKECINLIHVKNMKRLSKPFSVEALTKISDNKPLSPNRTTAGGWAYVFDIEEYWLMKQL
ncbi:hypothetical protein FJZ31_10195 [Candidatus Poribacteria bacterium]|nr:hypothetical protein [Candidatus Poribacteria bacterium]